MAPDRCLSSFFPARAAPEPFGSLCAGHLTTTIPRMSQAHDNLTDAARQLLAIESLLGCDFIPAQRNPLPELEISSAPAPAPAAETPAAAPAPGPTAPTAAAPPEMDPQAKATAMKEMDANEVAVCRNCVLCKSRNNTVFGEGDFNADLVFVGEAPGADEDQQGRPFVGRAGQLLTNMITAMGLSREQVFILNMVKCRPPNNRTPLPDEIHACWSYLVRQLQIIRPRVIVTLGNPAMQNLLQTRVGITKLRGNWQKLPEHAPGLGGIDVMPTFHPSYVLRRYTPEIRRRVWSDLQAVMQYLGLELPGKD